MRVIATVLLILFSFISIRAQELSGYFVKSGIYSLKDSSYTENNISGNSITVEFFNSKLSETNIIRIGHKTKIGTTYHDYIIMLIEVPENKKDYTIVVANDKFGADIAFKYNNEDFVLLYGYNERFEQWTGYYAGMLLNRDIISFLSTKKLSK
ncbi:MAG: hypothetical protein COA97_05510 [Flavobacteriales bacterium]|nr:MAG: hypothetical protein COA97_05510 [Flavobacteriales bacterium]